MLHSNTLKSKTQWVGFFIAVKRFYVCIVFALRCDKLHSVVIEFALCCDKNKILEFFAKLLMRMQLTPLIHKVTFVILTLLKE